MEKNCFYTLKGYQNRSRTELSAAMEDYLEMIARNIGEKQYIRINTLAALLHVKPSSSSKMVQRLKETGYVQYEPYGIVKLTEKGKQQGEYLLHRHEILHRFFCAVNQSENELELVEKLEHSIDQTTLYHMEQVLPILENIEPLN